MVCEDPYDRPSAVTLAQHPVLCPQEKKTRLQLRKELNEERFKNQMLARYYTVHSTQFTQNCSVQQSLW